jgi:hypothetical protein
LISTHRDLDPDVPSPGQFNHVIRVVEQGNERIWLDTTPEVAPFEFLLASLRGKHSLVIPPARPATLQVTPENPDLKSSQTFDTKASLDDQGTLTGDAERTIGQSDFEVLLRSNFRSLAMPQWKDLVQRISYSSGFGGDVSQVSVTPPEDLSRPFRISYKYNRKNYSDWDDHRIGPPLPFIYLPEVKDDDKTPTTPLWLGVPGEVVFRSSVVLPKGYSLEVPKNVDLKEDFAEYHATYSLNESTFTTERHLTFSVSELPVSTYAKYKAFRKQVNEDHDLLANSDPDFAGEARNRILSACQPARRHKPDGPINLGPTRQRGLGGRSI